MAPIPDQPQDLRRLGDILDALEQSDSRSHVTIGEILAELGTRSFAPIILIPALALVSPLSGIFGLPTIGAVFIFIITVQKLVGRAHVWVPQVIKRRRIATPRVNRAVSWLRRPCRWIDAHSHRRLSLLTSRPANVITLLTIIGITLVIPFLEVLPMVTSVAATAISFFAIAMLSRDGIFTVLGYIWVGFSLGTLWWILGGAG